MSYAKSGEDSDVYVFGSAFALECYVRFELVDPENGISYAHHEYYAYYETLEQPLIAMLSHLDHLKDMGLKIPEYCTEKMRKDIEVLKGIRTHPVL